MKNEIDGDDEAALLVRVVNALAKLYGLNDDESEKE